jgi:hypothetical protein
VSIRTEARRPGEFARARFRARRRAWRLRLWWAFPVLAILELAIFAALGLVLPAYREFLWGVGVGVSAALVLLLADSPPQHVERWRQGAEGEQATAKALRRLTRRGWTLFNDIDTGRGNIDHVLIGPAGVFLLETKNLQGVVAVKNGVVSVRWKEDPTDGYENHHIAARARASSAALAEALSASSGRRWWVQPLVVLWADFAQTSVEDDRVAWVRGKDLARVLEARRVRLTAGEIAAATAAVRSADLTGALTVRVQQDTPTPRRRG